MKKELFITILIFTITCTNAIGQTSNSPIIKGEIQVANYYISKSNNIPFRVERQGNYAKVVTFNEDLEIDKQIVLKGVLHYYHQQYGETSKNEYRSFETIYSNHESQGLTAGDCLFTQTLFNNDEDIEFLAAVFNNEKLNRFEIISETGNVLTTYNIPKEVLNNIDDYNYYASAYTLGIKKYLIIEFYHYYKDEYLYAFYPAEAGTSTNTKTYNAVKTMAYPNPVNRNEPLTIQLANPASTNTYVELFTINGTRAGRYKINEGEQQFSLPTTKLSAGQYIYHISAGGKRVDSGKVIVK